MSRLLCLLSAFAFLSCSTAERPRGASALRDQRATGWKNVLACEGEEAVIKQHADDPTRYRLTLKNNDLNMYLGLGYLAETSGYGDPIGPGDQFVGFSSVIARFDYANPNSPPLRTAHVFPDHGGLKVLVEVEPYYLCDYNLHYGDSSGMTHTVSAPIGASCPDLGYSYGFRNARPGSDVKTSKNWFFQNCHSEGSGGSGK